MHAFPKNLSGEEQPSGLTCPECLGVLGVREEGPRRTLHFRCRTGHAYAAEEVLVGKEDRVENLLWMSLTALDELMAFLRDLIARGKGGPYVPDHEDRLRRAEEQKKTLVALIAENTPVCVAPGSEPDAGTS